MILCVTDYCPFCLRCILALREKNIDFELIDVDLSKKAERLQDLSPYRRVPVLKHDGKAISESSIISEYLEEIHPEPALLPVDPWARAEARFWIDFCNTRFMPAYFNLLKAADPAVRNRLRRQLLDHLAFMDEAGLAPLNRGQSYWMGDRVGLVDFAIYPFFERFAAVEAFRDVEIPPGLERLHAWLETMRAHRTVRSITKPREHYIEYFREFYAD